MNKALILSIFLIMVISACTNKQTTGGTNQPIASSEPITLQELYNNKITDYVGQKIFLKTKIEGWPTPTVSFENNKRGNFFIVSDKMSSSSLTNAPTEDRPYILDEKYYTFEGENISVSNRYYILGGFIEYRDWLNVDEQKLNNPRFIEESNNVTYWSQKFEFNLVGIEPADEGLEYRCQNGTFVENPESCKIGVDIRIYEPSGFLGPS